MATTASSEHPDAPPQALAIGVCVPNGLSERTLRRTLAQGGHSPVFWHSSVAAAADAWQRTELDLFVLGARRPDSEVLECIGALGKDCPSAKAVLICERSSDGDIRKSLNAGIHALVPSDDVSDALLPVIEVVKAGQVSVPGAGAKEAGKMVLTAREKQILGQVVLGMTNAEIAAKLFLAESTVKSHLSSAFAKLGVSSRNEATTMILDPRSGTGVGILTIPTK